MSFLSKSRSENMPDLKCFKEDKRSYNKSISIKKPCYIAKQLGLAVSSFVCSLRCLLEILYRNFSLNLIADVLIY